MITFKAKTTNGEIINSALAPFQFPAGEAHTKREDTRDLEDIEIAILQPTKDSLHDDLFQLAMWDNILCQQYAHANFRQVLLIPYFPGARSDRGFPLGAHVYSSFLNNMSLNEVHIFDVHSPVSEVLLSNGLYPEVIHTQSADILVPYLSSNHIKYDAIIAPDAGAMQRAALVASKLGIPVITAEKSRDFETGKLSGFHVKIPNLQGKYLVVDDICDGGGTFLGLAEASGLSKHNLDLYVSHGVFSNNALKLLPEKFGKVYTTNSYAPERPLDSMGAPDTFQRIDVIRPLLGKVLPHAYEEVVNETL